MANFLRSFSRSKLLIFHRSFSTSLSVRNTDRDGFLSKENDPDDYKQLLSDRADILQERLKDPNRFQPIGMREERSILSPETVKSIMTGKYINCVYRGIEMLKGPEDLAILYQVLWHVKPRTVIELGAFTGASALWIADSLNISNIECNVFSTDIDLSLLHPLTKAAQPPNLTFIECDNSDIDKFLSSDFLKKQPHPFIIIDDAHENFDKAMGHFHHYTIPGDYILCEDTSPDVTFGMIDKRNIYVPAGFKKLNIWKQFLAKHGDTYAIDSFFCDLFGYNGSSNWDGYARRMK